MRTGLTILLDKHGRVDVVNRTHFILAYVFSLVTIFVEVQISEILSRVAAWLNLIRTLRCRHLEIVTISKILTVAHIKGMMVCLRKGTKSLILITFF